MLHTLKNDHWHAGVLPEIGGSIAFGQIRHNGVWVDVIRPTPPDKYNKPSSFLMLPWSNRIRDGVLRYNDQTWQLPDIVADEKTARHGDVRKRPWTIESSSATAIHLHFDSALVEDFNFPFTLTAEQIFALDGTDFVWEARLTNTDSRTFPAGFGFHPYFQHTADNMPLLQVPCDRQFVLENGMASDTSVPVSPEIDFRKPRAVTEGMSLDHLLTGRIGDDPVKLIYEEWDIEIQIISDAIYAHVQVFTAPDGTLAVEPQTNANDGFNLYARGIPGTGIFEIAPGETVSGTTRLRVVR